MQLTNKGDGDNVGSCGSQQDCGSHLSLLNLLLHQSNAVTMNGVRDLVTKGSGQLLGVLYKVEKRIHHVDVASWCRERIRLGFVHKKELKRMGVAGLGHAGDGVRKRLKDVVQGRGVNDLGLLSQLL